MTSKVRPEVRRIGSKQFPRWVIIEGGTKVPSERRFWSEEDWMEGLGNAVLFAHKDAVLKELEAIKNRS